MNPILFGVVFGLIMVYLIIDTLIWNPKNKTVVEEKDTRVLKLVADWRYGTKPEGTRGFDEIPVEERDCNSWWYLHGKLAEIVGYDKAMATNCKSGGFAKDTINWSEIDGDTVINVSDKIPTHKMYVNGIIDVEIEGINEPCVGYFWTTYDKKIYWEGKAYDFWEQRGLVCLKSDEEGCKDAKTRYDLKCKFL